MLQSDSCFKPGTKKCFTPKVDNFISLYGKAILQCKSKVPQPDCIFRETLHKLSCEPEVGISYLPPL